MISRYWAEAVANQLRATISGVAPNSEIRAREASGGQSGATTRRVPQETTRNHSGVTERKSQIQIDMSLKFKFNDVYLLRVQLLVGTMHSH